jgi:hypothetical protein
MRHLAAVVDLDDNRFNKYSKNFYKIKFLGKGLTAALMVMNGSFSKFCQIETHPSSGRRLRIGNFLINKC